MLTIGAQQSPVVPPFPMGQSDQGGGGIEVVQQPVSLANRVARPHNPGHLEVLDRDVTSQTLKSWRRVWNGFVNRSTPSGCIPGGTATWYNYVPIFPRSGSNHGAEL